MLQKPSSRYQLSLKLLFLLAVVVLPAGCATVTWYGQAARGQMEVLFKRQDIAQLIENPDTSEALRSQLQTVLEIREFATTELGLPDSRSYRLYADLGRAAPLWNVVAVPACSMTPKKWCYPLTGCLGYRGYFRRSRADRLAERLQEGGFDVQVSPVAGYSTLGWFADPVLASMLDLPEVYLAELIFHELAHELLFVRGDTAFNEAFATFVGRQGARRWLQTHADEKALQAWQKQQSERHGLVLVLLEARQRLAEGYRAADGDEIECLTVRQQEFSRLDGQLTILAEQQDNAYAHSWRSRDSINNASLALLATYEVGVRAFERVFSDNCGQDLDCLYSYSRALARSDDRRRSEFMRGKH